MNKSISLIIGADVVPTNSNKDLFEKAEISSLLGNKLEDLWHNADFRVFNLEVPLTDKKTPIYGHGVNSFWVLSPITNGRATSHCGFTEILCSFGVIGFFLFYWNWFWTIIKKSWLNIKTKARNKELSLFTIILIMLFVMEWQTTSFQSATTVSLLAVIFKILKYPKQYNL